VCVCVCVSLGVIRHNYPPHLQGLGRKGQTEKEKDITPCFKISTLLSVMMKLTNLNHNSLHIIYESKPDNHSLSAQG
jgi:hypothetical protein